MTTAQQRSRSGPAAAQQRRRPNAVTRRTRQMTKMDLRPAAGGAFGGADRAGAE